MSSNVVLEQRFQRDYIEQETFGNFTNMLYDLKRLNISLYHRSSSVIAIIVIIIIIIYLHLNQLLFVFDDLDEELRSIELLVDL